MANQNNNDNDENKNVEDNGNGNQNENNSQGSDNNSGGNQNQGASGGSNDNSGSGNNGNQQGGKTFTQEDVNRMMAKEKQQGRNSVFNELGISPDDADIISIIKAVVAAKGGNEDDLQGNENSAAIAQAEERARIAEMKADAMKAGVKAQYVDDAVDLVRARYSDDNNDFNAILNELKSKYAIWFEETEEDDKGGAGKRGTGSTISAKNQQGGKNNQEEGLGKRLAGLRRPQTKKSSYFSS